jgi:cytochrome c553
MYSKLVTGAVGVACALALLTLDAAASSTGADAQRGRQIAASTCRVCHGIDGLGTNPTVPHIAGESEMYLIKQLQDFRAGRRENAQMSVVAASLDDESIRHLAAWYSSIKISVTLPEN